MVNNTYEDSWDAWAREWENANAFFSSKGNVRTRSKLKDKWYKEFMNILDYYYKLGQNVKN